MRLRIAAALLSTVALAAASVPAADASAHRAAPRVRVTGWTLQTSDHTDDDAVQEPNGASYTMGCDTILEIAVKVTAKHVRKNTAFSWRTTYTGATAYQASRTRPGPRRSAPPPGREHRRSSGGSAPVTTLGTIGSGNIGSTVARLAVNAGHEVVLSNSRGPETLADLAAELGPQARAGTTAEAAAADVVLVTIPLKAYRDLDPSLLAGKVVIDTMNYYPQRDGQIAELDDKQATTSGLLQAFAPDAKVVKAFNNIFFQHLLHLARPQGDPNRTPLLIAGDDEGAKALASSFIESLGYDVLDTGSLAESWRYERDQPAYAGAYGAFEEPEGQPTDAARLQDLLDEAVR